MKQKIILSLVSLFMLMAVGAAIANYYLIDNTSELERIIRLHEVEQQGGFLLGDLWSIQADRVKSVLLLTLFIAVVLGTGIAVYLTRFVTRPVKELVDATRLITSGKLGGTITYKDNTEFGELAGHFNDMSAAIKESYEKVQEEIKGRWQAEDALSESMEYQNMILDSIRDPFCIIDSTYRIVKVNEAYAELKGRNADEIIGKRCCEILRDGELPCTNCIVKATFRSSDPCAKDKKLKFNDGSEIWVDIYTYPIMDNDGNVSHVIEYIRDITDRKITDEALRDSEERYILAARGANDGLWDWDLQAGSVYFSSRWKAMFGYAERDVGGDPNEWMNRIHPDDRMQVKAEINAHIDGQTAHFESEHRVLHKDGNYIWVLSRGLAVRDPSMKAYRMAGSITDMTTRKKAEEQLIFDAMHDELTGLPNRALFMDRLRHLVDREKRNTEYLFAVVFFDLDRFKVLNDSLGHLVGDKLLVSISRRLEECLRPGDTVARLGGDEFAILLEDLEDRKEAMVVVKRLQDKMLETFRLDGHDVFTSASVGIAFNEEGHEKAEHFLRNADIAMYYAKENGSGKFEIFDKGMYNEALTRLQLENDLRHALESNEFFLHYQPIVSVKTGRVKGMEALIRWQHPSRGLVPPTDFIYIAEETGMIVSIGEWALQEACSQLKIWQKRFASDIPLTMSVNVSSRQLLPGLIKNIKRILNRTAIEPGTLILEITETMLMKNAEYLAPLLQKLKNMNIKLHIDDFGSGYSSLSYLRYFPVDVLKIDRSFISGICTDSDNLQIVRAITALAHSLNMNVIAEGVETQEQIIKLKSLECDFMQGFYFSRPMDSNKIEELLRESRFDLLAYLSHNN